MGKKAKGVGLLLLAAILFVWFSRENYVIVKGIYDLMPSLTLIVHLILLFLLIAFILSKMLKKEVFWKSIMAWIKKHALLIGLITATSATLGSLFYSLIAGLYPCDLCWYQRTMMYPLPIVFFVAWKNKYKIYKYTSPLAIVGGIIAAYHYATQFLTISTSCSPFEAGISCSAKLVHYFGYITIPLMALTAFIIIYWLSRIDS